MFRSSVPFFGNKAGDNNHAQTSTNHESVGSGKSLMPGESIVYLENVLAVFDQAIKSLSGQFSALPPGARARSAFLLQVLSNARAQLEFQLNTNSFTSASPAA